MTQDAIRLLVVEDEPGMRAAIIEILRYDRRILATAEASTLAEAIAVLDRGETDVIVLDLLLPDSRGADTAEALVARFPEIPVVVLTAMDLTRPLIDALTIAGAFAFMRKDGLFNISLTDWIGRAYVYKQGMAITMGGPAGGF